MNASGARSAHRCRASLALVDLLLLGHRIDRAHVVQAIGELDQDDRMSEAIATIILR